MRRFISALVLTACSNYDIGIVTATDTLEIHLALHVLRMLCILLSLQAGGQRPVRTNIFS